MYKNRLIVAALLATTALLCVGSQAPNNSTVFVPQKSGNPVVIADGAFWPPDPYGDDMDSPDWQYCNGDPES